MTAQAFAEKGSLAETWTKTIAAHRAGFSRFEMQTETFRFEVRDATHLVQFEQGEEFLRQVGQVILEASPQELASARMVTLLADVAQEVFGFETEVSEILERVVQRDAEEGFYRLWDRKSGALAIFDRHGTWQQDRGEISLGPPVGEGEIEVYLARLGLLIPENAVAERIPETTPEAGMGYLVHMSDLEGVRFRFGSTPWTGSGRVSIVEESPFWEEIEQGIYEKKRWYSLEPGSSPDPFVRNPVAGIELRYDMNRNISGFAITRVLSYQFDSGLWTAFPRERPPIGWNVLDYRFTPETEYRFGFHR